MNHQAPTLASDYAPDWGAINAISITEEPTLIDGQTVSFQTNQGQLFLQVLEDGVRLYSRVQREYDYGLIVNPAQPQNLSISHDNLSTQISSKTFKIYLEHAPFAFAISSITSDCGIISQSPTDGHFVRRHRIPPLAKVEEGWLFCHDLKSSEPVYGLGEKWGALNKRGQLLRSYNSDALGVNAEISYKNTPFCWSPSGWGVFVHTPAAVTHAVGHPSWSQRSYCCLVEDDVLDIYLLLKPPQLNENVGASMLESITELTGRAPMPPSWSGGVILSKAYYQNPEELLAVAKEVRARNMPCDTITIDGRAWQDTDTRFAFEWDPKRWPDPKKVLDELKELNFKVCVWEYPLISGEHAWFEMFAEKGWLLKDRRTNQAYEYDWDMQAFGEVLTKLPRSGIVDFTHPDAYDFWREAHKELFDIGVDMIKADFGEQVEDDNMLASNGETGLALHNVYADLYNRCVYEAAEKYCKSGPFLFSRSAWIGSQRFNSQWGGDPQADWEGMMGNIRGGLSWGLSGAPFYATDVGGFYKDTRDSALYVRWAQAAVFSAHYRLHGIGEREPWSYSDEANEAALNALKLRYQLQTYLQKTMQQSTETGLPVQRPMVLALPDEKQTWAFENQFMFGDDILVVPCFDPSGLVEYYLPKGEWVRLSSQTLIDVAGFEQAQTVRGGDVINERLELGQICAYVRKGVTLPINKLCETTQELTLDDQGFFKPEFLVNI